MLDPLQGSDDALEQMPRFTSVMVTIEYTIAEIRDGMQFVGWEQGDLRYPHAYTRQSLSPGMTCCLFPCVDKLTSRCTWDMSITCSRTVGDALLCSQAFPNSSSSTKKVSGPTEVYAFGSSRSIEGFNDEDWLLDLVVVGTGDLTDEVRY